MSDNGENKRSKLDIMRKGFELWLDLAMTRMGLTVVDVPEEKKAHLKTLLEGAFEAGYSMGFGMGGEKAARELMESLEQATKNGKAIVMNGGSGIPVPDVGHA